MQSFFSASVVTLLAAVSMTAADGNQALQLAATGHCAQAVPLLSAAFSQSSGPEAKKIGEAGVRCSLALNDSSHAVSFLTGLQRRFPHDPSVLYLATHAYSDLSMRASTELLNTAPGSVEVHELNAEALESMGKWDDAAAEYRAILEKHPDTPGIHYRLGRILLSKPDPSDAVKAQAKQEFADELKVDPNNAGANFVLGELDRQAEDWADAARYFTNAIHDDAGFFDAYLGLGRTYVGSGEFAKSVAPLETAEKLEPDNAEVHFQLSTAFHKLGRAGDADREAKLHQDAMNREQRERDRMHQEVTGSAAAPADQ